MATPDRTTPAQAVLALYGALDDAVTSTGSAEIEAIVSRYLPGSTGPNAGWYEQLLVYLGQRGPSFTDQASVPILARALTVLKQQGAARVPQMQSQPKATSEQGEGELAVSTAGIKKTAKKTAGAKKAGVKKAGKKANARGDSLDADAPDEPRPLSTVQKSRMVFAIGTLSQLPGSYLRNEVGDTWQEQFSQALEVAGGPPKSSELLDFMRLHLNDRDGYPKVLELAAEKGLIDRAVALVPLCQPKLMTVRGYPCLVITTEFPSAEVSLDDLKKVIDPLNWAKCLSTFFCRMHGEQDRDDGWSRVLEHVSTTCWIAPTHMKTPLKYWKSEDRVDKQPPTICVEYALDDEPLDDAKGDGPIVIDEGFIRMTSTGSDSTENGVRVRTRKVVGFRNAALTPWGVLACSMGYGDQGIDMLLGGVERWKADDGKGWTAWKESKPPSASGPAQETDKPVQEAVKPAQAAQAVDTDTSRRAVELAVEMLNECIDDMSEKSAAIAAKWASGVVPVAETMAFSTDLASRLAIDPWRYLERLRDPARGGDK
jgi:hypothetical protein